VKQLNYLVKPCLNNTRKEGRKEGKEERKEEENKENSDYPELNIQVLKINTLTIAKWICFQRT
jgi:hypothetical protein